jgi:predicted amidohydrolase
MGQMLVEGGEVEKNLARAAGMIHESKKKGCAIIVLPECLDIGWTHPRSLELAQPIPGKHSAALADAAMETGLYVVAGLTERAGDRVYNAAVLISPEGEVLRVHRKINVLGMAQDFYSIGDSLAVTETPLGVIAINICADNFMNSLELALAQARMGAQLLLSPSAWAVDGDHKEEDGYGVGWRNSYSTLSKLHNMTCVGVSNVGPITAGPWEGRKCIGCSVATAPGGEILAQASYGMMAEELLVIEVEPQTPAAKGTAIAQMRRDKGYEPGWGTDF